MLIPKFQTGKERSCNKIASSKKALFFLLKNKQISISRSTISYIVSCEYKTTFVMLMYMFTVPLNCHAHGYHNIRQKYKVTWEGLEPKTKRGGIQRTSDLHTCKVLYNMSNKLFDQSSSVLVTASTFKHVLVM